MLAAAGVLGSVAVAQAQPPPPADQPPAPPAAEFGVAPAALPAAVSSAPPPAATFGTPSGPDAATPAAEPEKKPNPWRFTRFTWGNTASTKIFGVGGAYQGTEDEQYLMDFAFNLRYYALDTPSDTVYVNLGFGWTREVTNSDTTTKRGETQFKDLTIGTGYAHTLYQSANKATKTSASVSTSGVFPTSPTSRGTGKYFTLNAGGALIQQLELAGAKKDWFADVLAFGYVGYSHLFSNSYTATNGAGARYPRQVATSPNSPDDPFSPQVSGSSLTIDTARLSLTYYLSIYKDFSFGNVWGIDVPFKHQFPAGYCVSTSTGCVPVNASQTAVVPVTTFEVSFSYLLYETVRMDLGYQNVTPELSDNMGKRRSVFYGPEMTFFGNVAVYLDEMGTKIYNAASGKNKKLAEGRFSPIRN